MTSILQKEDFCMKLNIIEEKEPLGTAGSLLFLDGKFNHPFFVTNCDVIIKTEMASNDKFKLLRIVGEAEWRSSNMTPKVLASWMVGQMV